MNRISTIWVLGAAVLLPAAVCGADEVFPVVHNDAITVRVLDAKNGKPLARAHVVLVGGYNLRDLRLGLSRQEALTDSDGAVHVRNALRNLPLVRVEVAKQRSCGLGRGRVPFSVELIRRDGMSESNRCGTAAVKDEAGMLTLWVKGKETQSKIAGAKGTIDPPPAPAQTTHAAVAKEPTPLPKAMTDDEAEAILRGQN
jgi:hypothetical protein